MNTLEKKTLKQFIVPVQDQPGALGKIMSLLGKASINVTGVTTYTLGSVAYVSFTAMPAEKVEATLKAAGYQVFWNNLIAVELPNKPGELGKFCNALGQEGINIQNLYGFSSDTQKGGTLLFSVADYDKAKKIVENVLAEVA